MYRLRTIDRHGDYEHLGDFACMLQACSMAELKSDATLSGNVIVTNLKTSEMLNFVNGKVVR